MLWRKENEAEKTPGEDGIGIGMRREVGGAFQDGEERALARGQKWETRVFPSVYQSPD